MERAWILDLQGHRPGGNAAALQIKLNPAVKTASTNQAIIGAPNGVTTSKDFTRWD